MAFSKTARGLVEALVISNGVSVVLYAMRFTATGSWQYWFLFWNLFLAWIPVLIAWYLAVNLKTSSWKTVTNITLTMIWLGFLPNSFYLMSDLIHLQSTGDIGILFDAVLFLSFIWNGALAGILSMVLVHLQIIRHSNRIIAGWCMSIVILLVSFAIYLGRSLRWNTWDTLINPAGIIFDVSERVINPLNHPQVFTTTISFFIFIGSMYLVVWKFLLLILPKKQIS